MGGYLGTYSSTSSANGVWDPTYYQQQYAQYQNQSGNNQLGSYGVPVTTTFPPNILGGSAFPSIQTISNPGHSHGYSYNLVSVILLDANGQQQYVSVDLMVVQHINMINQIHANLRGIGAPLNNHGTGYLPPCQPAPITKMADGEFTLDEMAEAEKILEEMGA